MELIKWVFDVRTQALKKIFFYSFELRVQTRNLDYFFLASKFDACGDAGELFKDFSYF